MGTDFFRNNNNNLDRDAGGGPAELRRTYANGLGIRQFYDLESLPGVKDFSNRTVLNVGEDVLVVDNIYSNQDNYILQYNLPRTAAVPAANSIELSTGTSQMRLSIFSQNSPTLSVDNSVVYQDRDGINLEVSRLRAADNGTGAPFTHPFFSFLTIVEPRAQAVPLGTAYAATAGATAAICVSRIRGDVITYVFVNTLREDGVRNTVSIPALAGWNAAFTSDADFGIFEFNRNSGVVGGRVYGASAAVYAGVGLAIRNSTDFGSSPLGADTHLVPGTQSIPHSLVRGNATVPSFFMDSREVTQDEYFAVREHRPSFFSGNDQLPVERITLYDAVLYCNRRSRMEGFQAVYTHGTPAFNEGGNCTSLPNLTINFSMNGYRLPTPDEWNAASGLNRDQAPSTTAFDGNHGWFKVNSAEKTRPVGGLQSVANSLFDITGNVAEWTMEGTAQGAVQAQGLSYEDVPSALSKSAKDLPANQAFPSVGFRAVRRNAIVVPSDQPTLQAAIAAAQDNQTIIIEPGTPALAADIASDRNLVLVFSSNASAQLDLNGHSIALSVGSIAVSGDPNVRASYFAAGGAFIQTSGGRTRGIFPSIESAVNNVASDETIQVTRSSYTIAGRAELGMACDVNGNNCSHGPGPENVVLQIDPHTSISLNPAGINGIYVNNSGRIDFGVGTVLNPYVVLIDGERTVEASHDRIGFFPNIRRSLEISQPRQTTQLGGQAYPLDDFVAEDEAVIGDMNPDIQKRTIINYGTPLPIPGGLPLVFHNDFGVLFKNLEFRINLPDIDVNQGIFGISSSGTMSSRLENCIFVNVNTAQPRRGRMFVAGYGAGKLEVWHCLFKNFHIGLDFNISTSGASVAPDIKANIFDGDDIGVRFSEPAHASKMKCNNFFENVSGGVAIGLTALTTEAAINQATLGGNLVRSPFFVDEGMLDFRLIRQIKLDFLETLKYNRWHYTGASTAPTPVTTIANPLLGACDGEDIGPILEVFKVVADNPFSKIRFVHPMVEFICDFKTASGPVIVDLPQLGVKGLCHEVSIPPRPKPVPVVEFFNFPYNRGSGPFLPITWQFTNRPTTTPYQSPTNVFRFMGNGWLNARATQGEFGPISETTVSKTFIPDLDPPAKPANFFAQRTPGGVLMTWNPPTDAGTGSGPASGGARYQIIRVASPPVQIASVGFLQTSFTDPEIIPGATYHIVAYDSMGNHSQDATSPVVQPWAANHSYQAGAKVTYNGIVYEARQGHTSQTGWEPPNVLSLWQRPTPEGTTEWTANTLYVTGSSVTFEGNSYQCIQGHTSQAGWEPPHVPALWQVSGSAPSGSLPAPWVSQDVGFAGVGGSATHSSGAFTVNGSGSDIWGTSDGFRFVYQALSGDVEIKARVTGIQNTNGWAKAGVMIRESLASGSPHGFMLVSAASGLAFQHRAATGGSSGSAGASGSAPRWVRLTRVGGTLTGYSSDNGTSWVQVGSQSVPLAGTVYVGLAVTAHNNSVLCQATFENVSATVLAPPNPWTRTDVGMVGLAGSTTVIGSSGNVLGSGTDIWDNVDAFTFVHRPLSGDGSITARVNSVQNTHSWAKAGVMVRESLAAGSKHAIMLASAASGLSFQRRISTGAASSSTTISGSAPKWIRLVRTGNSLTGYVSPDGATWTQVGTETVSMGANIHIGLAVTSHNNSVLCTAVFDNIAVVE